MSAPKDNFNKATIKDEQFGELWEAIMAFNEDYKIRSWVIPQGCYGSRPINEYSQATI